MTGLTVDFLALAKELWPNVYFYKEQREIIESVQYNDETYVPAGNELGKDFVSGFICLAFYLTRHPVRIITTSAKDDHLRVLWGEIGQFIQSCKYPLDHKKGGPLIINHQEIRKVYNGVICPKSYLKGMVASPDTIAAMQGHHIADTGDGIPKTLFVSDESSSVPDDYYKKASTWLTRALVIGNTWPCNNFFFHSVENGDLSKTNKYRVRKSEDGSNVREPIYYRKVIRIEATDSPNVRYGLAQQRQGIEPTGKVLVPGVKSWNKYQKHLQIWDEMQQEVCLRARFYKGKDVLMYPALWLTHSFNRFRELLGTKRVAKGMGVDPGEGEADTAIYVVDHLGIIDWIVKKTPDTTVIEDDVINLMRKHRLGGESVNIDQGGGGKQLGDRLRKQGYDVRITAFGASVLPDIERRIKGVRERQDEREERILYRNRRAQMYCQLKEIMNPQNGLGFAIPFELTELVRQLKVIPVWRDEEGAILLPKKNRKPGEKVNPNKPTLQELLGRSPDDADALVLAVDAMLRCDEESTQSKVEAFAV